MTLEDERARLRAAIGPYSLWRRDNEWTPAQAATAEALGFGSIWVGGSPPADLADTEALLAATDGIVVATGIVNIWAADAAEVADSFHRIEAAHPGRFVLGIGPGHPERVEQAKRPYTGLVDYLDALESRGVPPERLLLAALGDRVLGLAGERTLGAHPYFVPPAHTAHARSVLGPSPLLYPEARVSLLDEPEAARGLLRPGMSFYFALANYRNNLLRLGYSEEFLDPENDDAIDQLATWGPADVVKGGLDAHLSAGADSVLVQLVTEQGSDFAAELPRLAAALGL